jgi:hypothetical protein
VTSRKKRRLRSGDSVEFEMGRGPSGQADGFPRWDGHTDRGGTGHWHTGIIAHTNSTGDIEVHYLRPDSEYAEIWLFSAEGFSENREGWVRRIVPPEPPCECGAEKAYGGGPHSHWCPRYVAPTPGGP